MHLTWSHSLPSLLPLAIRPTRRQPRARGAANIAVDCLISIMTDKKSSTSARANAAMFVWRGSGMSAAKEAQNVDDMSEDDVVDLLRTLPADLLARALEEVA